MDNKKIGIEMADMVGKTYQKIAMWYNEDFESQKERQEALKVVGLEVVQSILEDAFLQIEGVNGTEVKDIDNKGTISDSINSLHNLNNNSENRMFQSYEDPIMKAIKEGK